MGRLICEAIITIDQRLRHGYVGHEESGNKQEDTQLDTR